MNDLGLTQQKVAERLGKSRPYIANMQYQRVNLVILAY
jgi:predicted transcriptional regulator